eukprot:Clim_evm4s164 gene=Clim_evmTU4s164
MAHYNILAENFDESWAFERQYEEAFGKDLVPIMGLKEGDEFADIGGGTGEWTLAILKESGLGKERTVVVDPFPEMLTVAEQKRGLKTCCLGAEEYVKTASIDKVLMKEVVHHIEDLDTYLVNLYKALRPKGRAVIITRPTRTEFPFFEAAHGTFADSQPDKSVYTTAAEKAGFSVKVEDRPYPVVIKRDVWYKMLRSRFMSTLRDFTEEEVEAGIADLDRSTAGQDFHFNEIFVVITMEKK